MIKCPCSEPQFKLNKIWGQNSTSQKLKLNSRKKPHINLTFLKPKIILPTYKNLTILITVFVLDNSLNGAILTSFHSFSTFHSFPRTDCNFAESKSRKAFIWVFVNFNAVQWKKYRSVQCIFFKTRART